MHADRCKPLILAEEPPLRLGALEIDPPTRQVHHRGSATTLEPRVMQVLVVLAREPGRVVGRQELFERCWDGRVVGDNAINRVISRLRHLAEDLGEDRFTIDTVARVGYRLLAREPATAEPALSPPAGAIEVPTGDRPQGTRLRAAPGATAAGFGVGAPLRRRLLVGGIAVGLAGMGAGLYGRALLAPREREDVAVLRQRAAEALRDGTSASGGQAAAYLREATRLAPQSAGLWGLLALALAQQRGVAPDSPADPLGTATRAAAERALALDAGNADAAVALAMLTPIFGHWAQAEAALDRLLPLHPQHPALHFARARVLAQGGRWRAALQACDRALQRDALLPAVRALHAWALWCAGQAAQAGRAFDAALALWPHHWAVWHAGVQFRMLTGQAAEAVAMLATGAPRPAERSPLPPELGLVAAQALVPHSPPPARRRAAESLWDARDSGQVASFVAVPILAALGQVDDAFRMLSLYYFGGRLPSREVPTPLPHESRDTAILFLPATAPLRADARFTELTGRIGLDAYWRVSGSGPDEPVPDRA